MKGETITLIHRVKAGEDPGGGIIWNISEEQVDDVLIQDGGQSNLTDGIRPDGIRTAKTIHMPRAWPYRSLRGAKASHRRRRIHRDRRPTPLHGRHHPDPMEPHRRTRRHQRIGDHAMPKVKLNLAGFRASPPIRTHPCRPSTKQATLIADPCQRAWHRSKARHYEAATHGQHATKGSVALATTGHGSEGNVEGRWWTTRNTTRCSRR